MKTSKEAQKTMTQGPNKGTIYSMVKEIAEVRSIKEAAELLHTGKWVAITATIGEKPLISLGRIDD